MGNPLTIYLTFTGFTGFSDCFTLFTGFTVFSLTVGQSFDYLTVQYGTVRYGTLRYLTVLQFRRFSTAGLGEFLKHSGY